MVGHPRDEVGLGLEHHPAGGQRLEGGLQVGHLVVDDSTLAGPGPGRGVEHQPHAAAVEEAEAGRGLEEELHSQDVAIERDRAVDVGDGDGDLAYLAQPETLRLRAAHE